MHFSIILRFIGYFTEENTLSNEHPEQNRANDTSGSNKSLLSKMSFSYYKYKIEYKRYKKQLYCHESNPYTHICFL
jgi:hypothetical protein